MEMWTVQIRDQIACSLQFDLDLHCPQKLLVLSSVRRELTLYHTIPTFNDPKEESSRKHWEKENMLVTSIFPFSAVFSTLS